MERLSPLLRNSGSAAPMESIVSPTPRLTNLLAAFFSRRKHARDSTTNRVPLMRLPCDGRLLECSSRSSAWAKAGSQDTEARSRTLDKAATVVCRQEDA